MRGSTAINPAAYSGGTFAVRPPNYTAYYMRAMMHQQAKQQALSQYYDKLQNSINPAGVRDVDLDGWNQKADAWQKFGIENRDALVNPRLDGGKSMAKFQSMHRDLLGDAQKSKQAAAKEMQLQKIYSNPNEAARATDGDMRLAHSIGSSIYDPQHYQSDGVTPHNLTEFSFNAPPYDYKMQKAVGAQVTAGLKPTKTFGKATQRDYSAGTEVIPFTQSQPKENLDKMAQRIGDLYDKNPSMQRAYENETLGPDRLNTLSKAYKSVYPNDDIMDDQGKVDHRKVAQAEVINDNNAVKPDQEIRNFPRIPQARQLTQSQLQQQYMMGWVNQMATAMKSGDADEVNRLGSAFSSGGNKNTSYLGIQPGKIGSIMPGVDQKQGFILRHVDNAYDPTTQTTKQQLNQDEFDPNDPGLVPKLAGAYQRMTGSAPSLKTGVINQIVNPGTGPGATPPKQPVQMPHGALDDIK